jgi:hypothetical protein
VAQGGGDLSGFLHKLDELAFGVAPPDQIAGLSPVTDQ